VILAPVLGEIVRADGMLIVEIAVVRS